MASSPDTLYSGGLATCAAVGAICGERGYLVHDALTPVKGGRLRNLLEDLKRDVTDYSNLLIWVAGVGSQIHSEDDKLNKKFQELVDKKRNYVLGLIEEYEMRDNITQVRWGQPAEGLVMTLDLSTGTGTIESLDERMVQLQEEFVV